MTKQASSDERFAREVFALLLHRRPWADEHPHFLLPGDSLDEVKPGTVLWGAGLDGYAPVEPAVEVRAVRGPWTANTLLAQGINVPAIFGDPMLLLPRYLPDLLRLGEVKTTETLVVAARPLSGAEAASDMSFINEPLRNVLRAIAQSRLVLSTSVTAVAVAEALGIAARFVKGEGSSTFARRDYLAGTGRRFEPIADSVGAAVAMGGYPSPKVDLDALDEAFPASRSLVEEMPRLAPPAYEVPNALLAEWVSHVQGGVASSTRRVREELIPAVREAAQRGEASWAETVTPAADYLTHVVPDVVSEAGGSDARLLSAVCARDRHAAQTAIALDGLAESVKLRAVHRLREDLLVSLALVTSEREWPAVITLVVRGSNGVRARVPWHLFDGQRRQWHLDLDFLVPLAGVAPEEPLSLSVVAADREIAVTTGVPLPLADPAARPEPGVPSALRVADVR